MAAAIPKSFVLKRLKVQKQQSQRWCWAAVTSSLNTYYKTTGVKPHNKDWKQCDLATHRLETEGSKGISCCNGSNREICDRVFRLSKSLKFADIPHYYFERSSDFEYYKSPGFIRSQIYRKKTPVVVRVRRKARSRSRSLAYHFVIIAGIDAAAYIVYDPARRVSGNFVRPFRVPIDQWTKHMGIWVGTYFKTGSIDAAPDQKVA